MRVSGTGGSDMQVKGTGMSPGMGEPMDEVSKGLQKKIENLQKQMKELSSNQEMPPDIKMKKRQELQKQISELQIQLRQHQMEVRREEARKKEEKASADDVLNPGKKAQQKQEQSAGLSAGRFRVFSSCGANSTAQPWDCTALYSLLRLSTSASVKISTVDSFWFFKYSAICSPPDLKRPLLSIKITRRWARKGRVSARSMTSPTDRFLPS